MNKTLVATALAAIFLAPSVSAIEIYKDDKNAVEIGGFIDVRVINTQGETEVVNGASRINFGFSRELTNGWNAFAKLEWGVNPVGSSDIVYNNRFESVQDEFFYNRLGYAGLSHDQYGTITIGKQWGAWYDVVYSTNYGFVWDGNTAGVYTFNKDDGAVNGVGRGDKTVQYRNAFGDFSFAVQAQLKNSSFFTCDIENITENECEARWIEGGADAQQVTYDYTYGGALTYKVTEMLSVSAGVNRGEFDIDYGNGDQKTAVDLIYGAGITWGNFDNNGLYIAANVNKQENHDTDNIGRLIKDAQGAETLVSYKFDNGLRPFISYNVLDAGKDYVIQPNFNADPNDVFKRQFVVVGLHFVWDPNTVLYVEARKDYSDFTSADKVQEARMSLSEDDGIAIGIRYTL
ncbi:MULTISPECIES: porin [Shewanella]|uniref:Porin n=1 Tax=Shewanella putrefaciens TaxID=24 RepID=A0ABX8XF95_SHEPU|nr:MULTISPECIES: porin [Shewanella]ABM25409.1 porin, Gram-negative type [Shewanella sp. W3-18-1]AVV82861.1 porin [Shewanella putrefaciens]MCT8942172.1 porin [Shewanella putrefaciens]MDR6963606.1 putative porin [Shewanella putrefaciens]QSE50777.1 porin [Shewanella putrefaciens]